MEKLDKLKSITEKDALLINGGHVLQGEISISGAKNSALPIIAAALLGNSPSIIKNVPYLLDIFTILKVISHLGVKVEFKDNEVYIDPRNLNNYIAPYELVKKMRASILVMGPLLAKLGKARIALPGGCAIGSRPVDLHLSGFELLGAEVHVDQGYIEAQVDKFIGNYIYLDIPSVGATENLMMAASLAEGETTIENAAREPEIVDLANFLKKMGAKIKGDGTDIIYIEGVKNLKGVSCHRVIPDRIEGGTYMIAGAITKGDIVLQNIDSMFLHAVIVKLRKMGVTVKEGDNCIRVSSKQRPLAIDVKTLPYPGFPTDLQAQMMAFLSTADGISIITETIFDNRFMHVGELERMGADIRTEGHSAIIRGVSHLSGAEVSAHDLRGGAALIIAGLFADGITKINDIYHMDRGYECIENKFSNIGADIKREKFIEEEG